MANTSLASSIHFGKPASTLDSVREAPKFLPLQVPGLKRIFEKGLSRGVIAEVKAIGHAVEPQFASTFWRRRPGAGKSALLSIYTTAFTPHQPQLSALAYNNCFGSVVTEMPNMPCMPQIFFCMREASAWCCWTFAEQAREC